MTTKSNQKGFTLVELLVVLFIIGIITSVATISINAARPSKTQSLYNKVKSQFEDSIYLAQLYNLRISINIKEQKRGEDDFYKIVQIQQFNHGNGKWYNKQIGKNGVMQFDNDEMTMTAEKIFIEANGAITPATVEFSWEDEFYEFETNEL